MMGIVREIDSLGRLPLPKELRRAVGMLNEGTEVLVARGEEEGTLILKVVGEKKEEPKPLNNKITKTLAGM